jgi:hypothetical protein
VAWSTDVAFDEASVRRHSNNPARTIEQFAAVPSTDPLHPYAHYALAADFWLRGQSDDALGSLQRVLDDVTHHPDWPMASSLAAAARSDYVLPNTEA